MENIRSYLYKKGYNYALARMEAYSGAVKILKDLLDELKEKGKFGDFEKGMEKAIEEKGLANEKRD